jgi:hypothetical protein
MEEKEKKVELGQQRNLRNEIFGSSPGGISGKDSLD